MNLLGRALLALFPRFVKIVDAMRINIDLIAVYNGKSFLTDDLIERTQAALQLIADQHKAIIECQFHDCPCEPHPTEKGDVATSISRRAIADLFHQIRHRIPLKRNSKKTTFITDG